MQILEEILTSSAMARVDGRPLFRYARSEDQHRRLGEMLRIRLAAGEPLHSTAAGFVFWAAEYIRASFKIGDQLSWDFVFRGLGLERDREFGVALVERGLPWWARELLYAHGGQRRFLYSLMAEGGLPEGLIVADGQKRRSLLYLVAEVEKAGRLGAEIVGGAVQRCLREMPQVFQDQSIAELLADLALKLVELRGHIPTDVPEDAFEDWLNRNRPDWQNELPLRLSSAVLNTLIRPALRSARATAATRQGSAVRRELRLRNDGTWAGIIVVEPNGTVAAPFLPSSAAGFRLRLLPRDADLAGRLTLVASPEESGWSYVRFGGAGALRTAFALEKPLLLAAYADGTEKGELILDPGKPAPEEAASLWRAADLSEGEKPTCLIPQPGNGRSKADWLWVLAAKDLEPVVSGDLNVGCPQEAEGGTLWPICGQGQIRLGTETLRITTSAESEGQDAQLHAFGSILHGWRRLDGSPIYLGEPRFAGEAGNGGLHTLLRPRIRAGLGRALGAKVVEWDAQGEILARMRLVILPESLKLSLRETSAGRVQLTADGLTQGWVLHLSGGSVAEVAQADSNGSALISLTITGRAPADLRLQLSDPAQGAAVELIALWPATVGMIVDPQGNRLDRDLALSFDALVGWRAVVPNGQRGTLQLRLTTVSAAPIALNVTGEFRIAAILPLIRMLLAQGGPDARVNLRLLVSGNEGRRLEVGRFDCTATIEGETLRHAGSLRLHAVDINDPIKRIELQIEGDVALSERLGLCTPVPSGEEEALWLVQIVSAELGRIRAFVWRPPITFSTREVRIAAFTAQWRELMLDARHPGWKQIWSLIAATGGGGDAAILDQVQALAKVPEAAIALSFRVPETEVHEALTIESLAPIFLPTVSVRAFEVALRMDFAYQQHRFGLIYDGATKAQQEAGAAIASRIGVILSQRPELAGHFGQAMANIGLPAFYISAGGFKPLPKIPKSGVLDACVGELARQAEALSSLPVGPVAKTLRCSEKFSQDLRSIIDAPIVCAEVALGLRPQLTPVEVLQILALRLKDPPYFETALPLAVAECAVRTNRT